MVAFEDDDPTGVGSGDDSQEDETMEDAEGEDAEDNDVDATMADEDGDDAAGDDDDDVDGDADDAEDDDDGPESPTQARRAAPSTNGAASSPPAEGAAMPRVLLTSPSPRPASRQKPAWYIPSPPAAALSARSYEIVPTMASPQSTSINAIAATPDMRWVFSGGADGYVRMYNWVDTANGKVPLTVAQKHPFVDSVMKAGSLTTYWENEDSVAGSLKTPPRAGADLEPKDTSPVHSLAVHHEAVWLLSGLETGAINLQTCRHQAGTRIATLREHTSAVSALVLSADETGVLSGSWDKRIMDWDLNVGKVRRVFPGSGGQISALEVRPDSNIPIPEIEEKQEESGTFSSNNTKPAANGNANGAPPEERKPSKAGQDDDALGSPDGSLFGENDHGSLFGDGDDNGGGGGGGGFGGLDDDDFGKSISNDLDPTQIQDDSVPPIGEVQNPTPEKDLSASTPPKQDPAEPSPPPPTDHDIDTTMNEAQDAPSAPAADTTTSAPLTTDEHDLTHPTLTETTETTASTSAPSGPFNPSTTTTSPSTQQSETTLLDAAIDGTLRLWDKRMDRPIARIPPQRGTPPWCMGACWSPDGEMFYAGRRNGTVDEYSVHRGSKMGEPVRTLKLPPGSGAVSAVRAMPNGRGLVCASHDILRVYDLKIDMARVKASVIPFLIVPGHRTGVISAIHVDPACRFMISAAGNRGWEGSTTEVLLGYEIGYSQQVGYLG